MSFNRKDYTARDYASIVSEVKSYINVNYPNLQLDFSDMSPEQLYLDIAAFIADGHHLYIDAAFSEFFVDSMAEQQNGISLGKWVGYEAPMLLAPSISLPYTYARDGGPSSVVIPRGTVYKDRNGNSWTVVEDQVAQEVGGTLELYQGVLVTDSWGGTSAPNQEVVTTRKGVASNIDLVVTIDGNPATPVTHLVEQDDGVYFEQSFNADTTLSLRCGDGINGCLVNSNLSVTFLITKGILGNIVSGVLRGKSTPTTGVELTYNNTASSIGGGEVASIEVIRRAIPAWVSSLNTLVTSEDYVSLVNAYPGIQLTSVTFDPIMRRNVYFVMSTDFTTVSTQTLKYLNNYLKSKYQINSSGIFKSITQANIILALRVYLKNGLNTQKGESQTEINTALTSFFRPSDNDEVYCATGKPIRLSDIYEAVKAISTVSYVEIDVFTREPSLSPVNWTESTSTIELGNWALRPTFRLNKQNAYGLSSKIIGDLSPAQIGSRSVKLVYNNNDIQSVSLARYLSKVGASAESSDWTRTSGMVPIEEVNIRMSNAYGNYQWTSWTKATEAVRTLMTNAIQIEMFGGKTAHFKISHVIDKEVFIDTGLGYLGTSYQLDCGSFSFILETQLANLTVTSEVVNLNSNNVGMVRGKQIVVSSVSGGYTKDSSLYTFIDDGSGALISTSGTGEVQLCGLIDYDKGIVVMNEEVTNCTMSYEKLNFTNKIDDESSIILSPYSNTIPLLENEYPSLYSLKLEVGFE